MTELDQEFVEYVVKAIVDNPNDVKVSRRIDEMGVLISLEVNPEDMGKIIGKEGRTAKAIRTLLRVLGAKNNARVNLKIIEPEGSTRPPRGEASGEVSAEDDKEVKLAETTEEPKTTKKAEKDSPADEEEVKPVEEETPTELV